MPPSLGDEADTAMPVLFVIPSHKVITHSLAASRLANRLMATADSTSASGTMTRVTDYRLTRGRPARARHPRSYILVQQRDRTSSARRCPSARPVAASQHRSRDDAPVAATPPLVHRTLAHALPSLPFAVADVLYQIEVVIHRARVTASRVISGPF